MNRLSLNLFSKKFTLADELSKEFQNAFSEHGTYPYPTLRASLWLLFEGFKGSGESKEGSGKLPEGHSCCGLGLG